MSVARKQITMQLLGAGLFAAAFSKYFFHEESTTEYALSIVVLLVAFSIFLLLRRAAAADRRTRGFGLLYGGFLSLVLGVGQVLYAHNSIQPLLTSTQTLAETILIVLGFTIGFGAAISVLLDLSMRVGAEQHRQKDGKLWRILCGKYGFFILVLVFLLAWAPCYLAYYPGVTSYDMYEEDSPGQLWQIAEDGRYSTFHPPIHTFLMDISLQLGKLMDFHGIRIYALGQMLALSMSFSAVLCYMLRSRFRKSLVLLTFLYFALHPVIAIFSFVPTKDVLLAGLFCVLTVLLHACMDDTETFFRKPWCVAALIAVLVFSCLFRKNVVYALLLATPFLVLAAKNRKRWMIGAVSAGFVGFFLIQNVLYPMLGVKKEGPIEMYSVPMQQIANTYVSASDSLTEQERETIYRYLSHETLLQYNPRFADPVKMGFQEKNYREDSESFWKIWQQLLQKYPLQYVDALLTLNLPYWYPDAFSVDAYAERDYIETGINRGAKFGFIRQSILPSLLTLYERVADYSAFSEMPLVGTLCSISLPIWVLLSCGVVLCYKKQYRFCCVLLPCIFLWMTFMAGPVSNLRYIIPILVQYPLLFAVALQPSKADRVCAKRAGESAHPLSEATEA